MASVAVRRVLSAKSLQASSAQKPVSRSGLASSKRQRSPEREEPATSKSKRIRALPTASSHSAQREVKKEKHDQREQQRNEFKEKYSKAFPNWSFYIDIENVNMRSAQVKELISRIECLGGRHEDFFSRHITHLITDKPIPSSQDAKENSQQSRRNPYNLKSPFKLKSKYEGEPSRGKDIVSKAANYGMKIWNSAKLDSVLSRCLDIPSISKDVATKPQQPPARQLERLLANEKTYGPSDRDPSQKRHDFRYFNKGSFFVLVEDLFDKTATIAMHEYPPTKDQKGKVPWPVLHCDHRSRGPFIAFDDKEKARWEKAQKAKNKAEVGDRKEALLRQTRRDAEIHAKGMGDLRRSVSLNNLARRWAKEEPEAEVPDSANASGFLVSGTGPGYMAASGNSVGVTSTTGTTSTTSGMAPSHLPGGIDHLMKRQVVTSRRALPKGKPGNMEPPPVPTRAGHLKKSKSTNTLKLPKREEGSKPGYCESCRVKFEDFKTHVISSKHRRFAQNDSNFATLDAIIDQLQRRPLEEAQETAQFRQLVPILA